jgi:hypothetical protein
LELSCRSALRTCGYHEESEISSSDVLNGNEDDEAFKVSDVPRVFMQILTKHVEAKAQDYEGAANPVLVTEIGY